MRIPCSLAALLPLVALACGADSPPPATSPPAPLPPEPIASTTPPPPNVADAAVATADAGAPATPKLSFTSKPLPLPGASGAVSLDYLAADRAGGKVWIPAGGTGSVDVVDTATGKMTRIQGFPTLEREMHGQKRVMGPSSASVGDGVVYVGNRATSEVCVIDGTKLTKGACLKLPSSPDGLAYVASAKELWVTTPKDSSLTVLDASTPAKLKTKTKITLDGSPEGYAVDDAHGLFFTNLEDKNKTVTVDIKTHKVTATWDAGCGPDGPRGLAVDPGKGFLFVGCTDALLVLDTQHGGSRLSRLETGAGVDNIDYLGDKQQVYVVAGKAATLTVAQVDDKGQLSVAGTAPTAQGTRVVVVDKAGNAYVADPTNGQVLDLVLGQ